MKIKPLKVNGFLKMNYTRNIKFHIQLIGLM